jgi:hypothetical protein
MSGVLFDTGKYSLKAGCQRETGEGCGHPASPTPDSTSKWAATPTISGGDQMNQTLSENRAASVRDYLVQEGVATGSVSSKGFGNTSPVASNDNSAGRQQNRRVELLGFRRRHRQFRQCHYRKPAVGEARARATIKVVRNSGQNRPLNSRTPAASRKAAGLGRMSERTQYAWNNIDRNFGFGTFWRPTTVAPQPGVGLRSDRRFGIGACSGRDSPAAWTNLNHASPIRARDACLSRLAPNTPRIPCLKRREPALDGGLR